MTDAHSTRFSRRDRARATRLWMIRAAQRVFITQGYVGTRMTDIAAEAGVAVQTVYFTFHTINRGSAARADPRPPGATPPPPPQQVPRRRGIFIPNGPFLRLIRTAW